MVIGMAGRAAATFLKTSVAAHEELQELFFSGELCLMGCTNCRVVF